MRETFVVFNINSFCRLLTQRDFTARNLWLFGETRANKWGRGEEKTPIVPSAQRHKHRWEGAGGGLGNLLILLALSPIVPPGLSAMAGAPRLWAEALLITEPLLHSAIRPQGGFMQNDTQYK